MKGQDVKLTKTPDLKRRKYQNVCTIIFLNIKLKLGVSSFANDQNICDLPNVCQLYLLWYECDFDHT